MRACNSPGTGLSLVPPQFYISSEKSPIVSLHLIVQVAMEDSPMPPTIDNLTSDLQTLTLESKEKEKDTEDTQEQLKLPDDVLVVDTEQTFQIAVSELKEYATWTVDCEGFNLGIEGGALSILSCRGIPGSPAKTPVSLPKTFLFDIVVLTHPETGFSIQPLLELLASSSIRKVFWDGRMDFCAIYFGLGTALSNVVDLQVVEMRRRISEENVQKQFQRLMRFFNPRHFQDPRRSKKYIHIHLLQGLGGCLLENKVGTKASKGSGTLTLDAFAACSRT
ncbi:hypothetical protein E1B28_010637 [Marasmius oreades]|uniref:3'-5' exonuclease domain-containing protein n=1 Tax=Marasmius oreades TaxID=181124 RepID=A0A9P7RXN9_9AGAR|nr:uncharacterized protein E1B28_010637 [Marasmius oreades]KAG7091619.1 hypothetical protein E1B28_010637 [Marasmius oreades]